MQPYTNAIPFDPAFRGVLQSARPLRLFSFALKVLDVIQQRRQLAELSDHYLADIGITREEAQIEAARPFWDLPSKQFSKMNK
ncbi:MAG: DUF1127 domain-containing protein [Rhodospirillales bacterium]